MSKYTEEFKESIVNLYNSGKPPGELLKEYGISSSAFYKWVKKYTAIKFSDTEFMTMKEINEMKKRLTELEEENLILKKYEKSKQRYGCIKIRYELKALGYHIGQNRVLRLMRKLGIQSIISKRYRKYSKNNDISERMNLLNRQFHVDKSGLVTSHTSELIVTVGLILPVYYVLVLDLCTRKMVYIR